MAPRRSKQASKCRPWHGRPALLSSLRLGLTHSTLARVPFFTAPPALFSPFALSHLGCLYLLLFLSLTCHAYSIQRGRERGCSEMTIARSNAQTGCISPLVSPCSSYTGSLAPRLYHSQHQIVRPSISPRCQLLVLAPPYPFRCVQQRHYLPFGKFCQHLEAQRCVTLSISWTGDVIQRCWPDPA